MFTNENIQRQYGLSLHAISKPKIAKVLNALFVNDTDQLNSELQSVAYRMGVHVEYFDKTYRYLIKQQIESFLNTAGFSSKKFERFTQFKNIPVILLNGVEFKGEWKYPNDIKHHKTIRFWTEEYRYKLVEAMHFEAVFPYAEYCDMRIVAVPYSNNDNNLALMIVLPNTIQDFNKILNQLDKHQHKILTTPFEFKNVNIDIPIFKREEKSLISNVLYKVRNYT